ncbi:hypothetical protein BC939DRAFT_460150 [Gamsiella multidivaricata]|uniref:uncharacterized protein n=1 Tax=Gamsiella multidivaricata TaxID=101098 RepID=UPI00221EB878|nr:uncharacterized protein BC939DRAFT_460150 [Gamsiella multidivaricata]KAG0368120.1 hypothetical protein BGZ54_002643 [Gamsiella multidivaricata]KAI7819402.1 hypothetical protein BC939DRAFT_460150 [Gamsiella multidivaricata]
MIKSLAAIAALATVVAAAGAAGAGASALVPLDHISFTQPVGEGITYSAGTNQTFSWTMACTPPSTLVSATPSATEVDFMDSNNIDNAFYVKKVGTIDCTKSVGNLVWTVPADTKPGVYALQLLLTPKNAYSGRFNVTAPGSSSAGAGVSAVSGAGGVSAGSSSSGGSQNSSNASGASSAAGAVAQVAITIIAGAIAMAL